MRIPGLGGWDRDPLWASVYDWIIDAPVVGPMAWKIGVGSDLGLLHEAAAELSRLGAGSQVLDIPCGGGVAVRGLSTGQGIDYVAADISQRMLTRTAQEAARQGVSDQVRTRIADVNDLQFTDEHFDMVLSFTGLHCFPDPHRAVLEMTRVLRRGGVISGSALCTDTGLRYEPLRRVGALAGVLGPGCTTVEIAEWLAECGVGDPRITVSGAIAYFRGVKDR